MKIGELLRAAIIELSQADIPTARLDARLLLEHAANLPNQTIYLHPELELSSSISENYQQLITRRVNREPVAKIIGSKAFWLDNFIVNNHTLDPRPDSEIIISAALELFPEKTGQFSFLDFGTGSGCLLFSLLREFPFAKGLGSDLSTEALKVARQNIELLALQDRASLIQQNWGDALTGQFDLIISNPPYIPTAEIIGLEKEVKLYDPMAALDGGADGLDPYRYLAGQIAALLKPSGYIILEFGYGQAESVQQIFKRNGYVLLKVLQDLAAIQRIAIFKI